MRRLRFYSDDSYQTCGEDLFHVVVAGMALAADRTNIRAALVEAERVSGKGIKDWYRTHPKDKQAYLEQVFDLASLHGRIFFAAFDFSTSKGKWHARANACESAIRVFTPGDCQHLMYVEGLGGSQSREKLRRELRERGCERVKVEPCPFDTEPEIRLADALAGYVRAELYRGDKQRAILTNLPDWLVELKP